MTAETRRFTIAGMIFVIVALFCLFCNAILHAQEVTDLPLAASDSPSRPASMTEKVSETIEGIKSGDISAAKQAVAFDKLLSYTLIRISDCWTLCKQEMLLAKECARREAVQTAKDIFTKSKDAAVGQTRESILESLPLLSTSGKDDLRDDSASSAPGAKSDSASQSGQSRPSAINGNDPKQIRESVQQRLSTPVSSGNNNPTQIRENIQNKLRGN